VRWPWPKGKRPARVLVSSVCLIGVVIGAADAAEPRHVNASLLAELESVRPGDSFWVGVRLEMDPPWHTYWKNPGDSGLATRVRWRLPDGLSAGPLVWPRPERMPAGPLMSYGYQGEVLLLSEITPRPGLAAVSVTLEARVDWLECYEACLPGKAELRLELPVRDETPRPGAWHSLFQATRRRLPERPTGWAQAVSVSERTITLTLVPPAGARPLPEDIYFYPAGSEWVDHAAPQRRLALADGYRLELIRAPNAAPIEALTGVLVAGEGEETLALEIEAARFGP
jgi:DsbC/DsbD-like thiol-disulfide interchange protein